MTKRLTLTQSNFDQLLTWLDEDRLAAGQKYESIRNRLIEIFQVRGCLIPEELADETIDRVTGKLDEILGGYEGDPSLYFYGVAKRLFLEYLRRPKTAELPNVLRSEETSDEDGDLYHNCLNRCLAKLGPEQSRLIVEYFEGDKREKIDHRKRLSELLGVTSETLRVRVLRIKLSLQKCVLDCVQA